MAVVEPSSSIANSPVSDVKKVEAEGLTVVWASPPLESSDSIPPQKPIDIEWVLKTPSVIWDNESNQLTFDLSAVVIDGVYQSWDDYTQSRTNSWVIDYLQSLESDCRILQFKYNPSQIIAGRRSREAIRKQALSLLNDLVTLRKNAPKVYISGIS